MPLRRTAATASLLLLAVCTPALAQSTEPFDHVHLAVPQLDIEL